MKEKIEKYLEWKATYTSRACAIYRPWLVRFNAHVKDKKLEQVTLDDIVSFRKWLDTRYQPYTIQLAMVAVHNYFKFWNIQGYRCISPSLVRVPRTEPRTRQAVMSEDFDKIVDSFKGKQGFIHLRDELIVRMLWDTGVRVSELCDLNINDLQEDKKEATVRTRKSNRMRQIFWSSETEAVLSKYLTHRGSLSASPALFVGFQLNGIVNRLSVRSVQSLVTGLSKELSLGHLTPHSFRHGKAHKILRLGGNIKHIGAVLGHAETNLMAATHYLHLNNAELQTVASRFLEGES